MKNERMKNERGEVLEVFIIGLGIVLMIGMIILVVGIIKARIDYGEAIGTVINKEYKPAYTTTTFMHTGKTMYPIISNHSEQWKIEIQKEINGEEKSIWIDISQDEYDNIQIGDYYGNREE